MLWHDPGRKLGAPAVIDGEDKLLKTDPEKWKATYDAAVKVKAAKSGVDVTKNVVSGMS